MYKPTVADERTTIKEMIATQLAAIRAAAYGLTDEQLRSRPLASALSISGIIKHSAFVLHTYLAVAASAPRQPREKFFESFALDEDESFNEVLADFDRVTEEYLSLYDALDPGQKVQIGPRPWYGENEPTTASLRWGMLHHLEEFARHAGHADLIREQLDGAKAPELLLAVEGLPGNSFVQPWSGRK